MTLKNLYMLANLRAIVDISGIDTRTEGLSGNPMSDDDRAYLREHGAELKDVRLADIADFCAAWRLTATVYSAAGNVVAHVRDRGEVQVAEEG